jgi:hypothetical protein
MDRYKMPKVGRMTLIAGLERVFEEHIQNSRRKTRTSIRFSGDIILKREGQCALKITEDVIDIFYSGKYQFGSNSIYIYQAIDSMLRYLDDRGLIDFANFEDEITDLQEAYDLENI